MEQRAWLDQVLSTADAEGMELVVWHPLRDQMPWQVASSCPCGGDAEICFYLDSVQVETATATRRLVTGGLWDSEDTERLGGTIWMEILGQ